MDRGKTTQDSRTVSGESVFEATRLAWRWRNDVSVPRLGAPIRADDGSSGARFVLDVDDDENWRLSRLQGERASGGVWNVRLQRDFVGTGALLAHRDWVFVVLHSSISSGGRLLVFAADTGSKLYKVKLLALGEVAHSEYENLVQLAIVDDAVVVYGNESYGRYVEAFEIGSWKRSQHTIVPQNSAP